MSEIYTVKGKTVAEAMRSAAEQYGGDGKELSYEIVNREKSGIFGFGKRDAEIRVTVSDSIDAELSDIVNDFKNSGRSLFVKGEDPSENNRDDDRASAQDRPRREEPSDKKSRDETRVKETDKKETRKQTDAKKNSPRPNQTKQTTQAPRKDARKPAPNSAVNVNGSAPKKVDPVVKGDPKKEESSVKLRDKKETNPTVKQTTKPAVKDEPSLKTGVSEDEMNFAVSFVNKMIAGMKLDATAVPAVAPENVEYIREEGSDIYPSIDITGADTGILIGHHGETLDSIQYLVNLALFRRENTARGREHIKITVDIENYRAKREDTLRALARRMAARAVKYKRNMFLEPMNPYERRIIHSELQDFEGVSTHSVGSDVNRKIVITYEGGARGQQNGRRKNGGTAAKQQDIQAAKSERTPAADVPSADTLAEQDISDGELTTASRVPLPTLDD